MSEKVVEKIGDVRIYGKGSLGGKGAGLVKINECNIPKSHKLRTRILSTAFFSRYLNNRNELHQEDQKVISRILEKFARIPISVRSSATNEGFLPLNKASKIRAGENTSFMLPNNDSDFSERFEHLKQAICHIYNDFISMNDDGSQEKMAIVINPIPGTHDNTNAGPIYYPIVSGVANSFFPYALKSQDPYEGFARIAFGHGYATVLDDFPVISMATIKKPIPLRFLRDGGGQQYFYAIDMSKDEDLKGDEMETMKRLNVSFADSRKVNPLGVFKNIITLEEIVQNDRFGFKTNLLDIMETISSKISSHFQIEFVFNPNFKNPDLNEENFHVVQLTQLPEINFKSVKIPKHLKHTYISLKSLQGHGVKRGITHAVVVSPFVYSSDKHEKARRTISSVNQMMKKKKKKFILIVPGRLGSKNKDWGIYVDYREINQTEAIFEYGVDITGRPEPLQEESNLAGGIYGSHFLYMIQGGYDEEKKRIQTRMYGTQGTHFLTNLMNTNTVYGFITPNEDQFDPWLFKQEKTGHPVNILTFPEPVYIYADSINQICVVASVQR